MSEIKEGDAVVRIWPSGTLTFGQARIGGFKNVLLFYSLENYDYEGRVLKNIFYGSIVSDVYKHRLATPSEIKIYEIYGEIHNRVIEIKTHQRDISIDKILS